MAKEYLWYAVRQLLWAIEKHDDAPGSSGIHENAAGMALIFERVPSPAEAVADDLNEVRTAARKQREVRRG